MNNSYRRDNLDDYKFLIPTKENNISDGYTDPEANPCDIDLIINLIKDNLKIKLNRAGINNLVVAVYFGEDLISYDTVNIDA